MFDLRATALNTCLGALPAAPSTWYNHDLAILPQLPGKGRASSIVARLVALAQAGGHPNLSLVAVGNSAPFGERQGFRAVDDEAVRQKLASYGGDAHFMIRNLAQLPGESDPEAPACMPSGLPRPQQG